MTCLTCILSNVVLASLLALAAWFVQCRLGRHAIARILWVLVLVKLVTPPLVTLPLGESSGAMSCALGTCACGPHTQAQTFLLGTLPWVLLAVWSAGAIVTVAIVWRRWIRFRRLIALASCVPPEWQSLATRLAARLSLRRVPRILAVPGRLPPLVVPGVRLPCILLPKDMMHGLSAAEKAALLLHELVHVKRGDHLVRLLELAVGVVYWWLPMVGSIGRQLRTCEETCCDAEVVDHLPQVRRDYARLLLNVVEFANPLPQRTVPAATAMSVADDLRQRMQTILDDSPRARRGSWPAGVFVAVMACAILPCNLHYGFVGRQAPESTSPGRTLAAESTAPSHVNRAIKVSTLCCPSY